MVLKARQPAPVRLQRTRKAPPVTELQKIANTHSTNHLRPFCPSPRPFFLTSYVRVKLRGRASLSEAHCSALASRFSKAAIQEPTMIQNPAPHHPEGPFQKRLVGQSQFCNPNQINKNWVRSAILPPPGPSKSQGATALPGLLQWSLTSASMKQVIRKGLKDIIVDEVPDPVLLPHHVLIRPLYSLISSGTETASIHRDSLLSEVADNPSHLRKIWDVAMKTGPLATLAEVRAKFSEYAVLGYSGAGVVAARHATVTDLEIGERVAPAYSCRLPVGRAVLDRKAGTEGGSCPRR